MRTKDQQAVRLMVFSLLLASVSCGKVMLSSPGWLGSDLAPGEPPGTVEIVKGRVLAELRSDDVGGAAFLKYAQTSTDLQPVSVQNAAVVRMEVSTLDWLLPLITNDWVNFGSLEVTELLDNDLKGCGVDQKERCPRAFVRVYTTGQAGPGMWNATDGYGIPVYAGLSGGALSEVGLGSQHAVLLSELNLTTNKRVVRLSDFPVPLVTQVRADFRNAGAGQYATTLVLEYGLSE